MPLIIVTGLPSTGKSTWVRKLALLLKDRIDKCGDTNLRAFKITVHDDELLGIPHDTYSASATEKSARGKQISAVKRDLSASNIVILDSLNYIKGFRYQLYCEAKGMVTTHCVIQVLASLDTALEWNKSNPNPWDPKVIQELNMRYEEPSGQTRWDSPLFPLVSDYPDETIPIDEIWDALVLKKPPPPNPATVVKPSTGSGFLQELDSQTLAVVALVIQHQQIYAIGGRVQIDSDAGLYVDMPSQSVSTATLQRIRRTYISLSRVRNIDEDRIKPLFVEYLNSSLNEE